MRTFRVINKTDSHDMVACDVTEMALVVSRLAARRNETLVVSDVTDCHYSENGHVLAAFAANGSLILRTNEFRSGFHIPEHVEAVFLSLAEAWETIGEVQRKLNTLTMNTALAEMDIRLWKIENKQR